MTGVTVAACLVVAAITAGWPGLEQRVRQRSLFAVSGGTGDSAGTGDIGDSGTGGAGAGGTGVVTGPAAAAHVTGTGRTPVRWALFGTWLVRRRASVVTAAVLLAAVAGLLIAGPVAGFAAGAYVGMVMRAVLRRVAGREAERQRRRRLDDLCALAADLRAGLPVSAITGIGSEQPRSRTRTVDRIDELTRAAVRLAERTGAPLADLIERIEVDVRSTHRGLAGAAAQAAGTRATALLLAGLPVGGIALGYAIGADPLRVLLYTRVGAACAAMAVVLQLAGMAWADRLSGEAAWAR